MSKNTKNKIYKTIILCVVLYSCEACLTLQEEHSWRVFENEVLRRTVGPTREEVTREWKRLHNEGFHNICSSLKHIRATKSRWMRRSGHGACMG
jgi:hypothetical protein